MTDNKGTITDTSCVTCSSAAEVNSVIDNEDLQLALTFTGGDALIEATAKCAAIVKRFPEASGEVVEQGDTVHLNVVFSCGAEKVIFMMTHRST